MGMNYKLHKGMVKRYGILYFDIVTVASFQYCNQTVQEFCHGWKPLDFTTTKNLVGSDLARPQLFKKY